MKKNAKLLVAFLVLIIIAVLIGIVWVKSQIKEATIYEWSRSISYDDSENYIVQQSDIVQATVMAADVKAENITNADAIVGKYLTRDVSAGSPVLSTQLQSDPTHTDNINAVSSLAEYRKILLQVNGFKDTFAGDIQSGDTVDLMFTFTNSGVTDETTEHLENSKGGINYANCKIFMTDVPVFQVYDSTGAVYCKQVTDPMTLNKYGSTGGLSGEQTEDTQVAAPAYVALTVTVDQYEEISARMLVGKVSLVSRFNGSTDQDTDGYILIKDSGATLYAGNGYLERDPALFPEDQGVVEPGQTVNENGDVVPMQKTPSLYNFIKDLAKISMTESEKDKYNSVYTRFAEYMLALKGTDWEAADPDEVTMEQFEESIDADDMAAVNAYFSFKLDLESLAKELKGSDVLLPWG